MMKRPCGTFDETYEQDMSYIRVPFRKIMIIILFLVLFILIPLYGSGYVLSVFNSIGITVIAMIGLNLLTGYCGLISVGHAAFIAVGAYTSCILSYHLNLPFWLTIPSSAIVSGLVGMLVALPSLRIKGFYIAISTLAFHSCIIWIIIHGGEMTKGVWGIPCSSPAIFGYIFNTEKKIYFFIMPFVVIAAVAAFNIVRSKIGRAFIAVRDNDLAAEFVGINIFKYKVLAFVLSSIYAGVAGSLMAHYFGMISVEQFTLIDSIWYLGFLIVGGMGSITGAIFAAIAYRLMGQLVLFTAPFIGNIIPAFSASGVSGLTQIFSGLLIILFLVLEPRGLFHRWWIILSSFRLWPFPY